MPTSNGGAGGDGLLACSADSPSGSGALSATLCHFAPGVVIRPTVGVGAAISQHRQVRADLLLPSGVEVGHDNSWGGLDRSARTDPQGSTIIE